MIPIRQGDGTGLSVPAFTEVRKGDGTVLWSAGAEIPDSGIPQYPYQDTLIEADDPGTEPHPDANNPVLTGADVTDISRDYVADPFLFIEDGTYYLFAEAKTAGTQDGSIVLATSTDGVAYNYQEAVINESYHHSYPFVFKWDGEYYIVPQDNQGSVELWKADTFPTSWSKVGLLVDSSDVAANNFDDVAVFRWDGRWWILASDEADKLNAYYADSLETIGYSEHSNNPIKTNSLDSARPGGRFIVRENYIVAFYQDASNVYGEAVNSYRITELSPTSYTDSLETSELIGPSGSGWNAERMHHFDPWWQDGEGRWLVAVDGHDGSGGDDPWSIGIYHTPTIQNNTLTEVQ